MAGYRDIYWQGDAIVWGNFIVNYVRSILHAMYLGVIYRNRKIPEEEVIAPGRELLEFSKKHKDILDKIIQAVFDTPVLKVLPHAFANRKEKIRKNELLFHLQMYHLFFMNIIFAEYAKIGFGKNRRSEFETELHNYTPYLLTSILATPTS